MAHPKNDLIERAQKLGLKRPEFQTDKSGPEHGPVFKATVRLDGKVIGRGEGASKRAAEAAAAETALAALESQAARSEEKTAGDAKASSAGPKKKAPAKKPAAEAQKPGAKQSATDKQKAAEKQKGAQPASAKKPAAKGPVAGSVAKTASHEAQRPTAAAAVTSDDSDAADEPFDGPWPMFDDLLAATLQVADRRVDANVKGEAALSAVRDFSLRLYRELLLGLGEIVEEEDEEDD